MAWQRFNRVTNIFEVSDNNGASWTPLVIAQAGLSLPAFPANVAYTNVSNVWTAVQNLLTNGSISGSYSILNFQDPDAVVGNKWWRLINYHDGTLCFDNLNDAGALISQPLIISKAGDIRVDRDAYVNRDIKASRDIYATTGYFERNRTTRLGEWTSFTPTLTASAGTVAINTIYGASYTLVGKMCSIVFYMQITITGAPTFLFTSIPGGLAAVGYSAAPLAVGAGAANPGIFQTSPSDTTIRLYRDITAGMAYTAGLQVIGAVTSFPVL